MADKAVSELIAAQQITATDLFVLEQDGTAKKLPGQVLLNWLTAAADGHGGIQSISKLETAGLVDTYRITLADTTTFDFAVTNGKSVNTITKTGSSSLTDTYTILFNDGDKSTFNVTNGAKGDKGDNTYVWIKYASTGPTEASHSFGSLPDDWIGIYFGPLAEAPADWKAYAWYQIKGEKGDTGEPAALVSSSVTYQVGDSGSIIPSGIWNESVAVVPQGKYLWTRVIHQFNTGDPVTSYSVSRMGVDGAGSVASVAGISPDLNGNVALTAKDVNALPNSGGDITGAINMNGHKLSGLNAPTSDEEAVNWGSVKNNGKLQFNNTVVPAASFGADTTYEAFPYRARVTLRGALPSMIPEVIFALENVSSGIFAPTAETSDGGIYLYAAEQPEADVTIPVILLWKGETV